MTEPTYTLTLTESERTAMARSLGLLVTKLLNAPVFVEAPSGGTAAARAVLAPSQDAPTRNASSEAAPPSGHVSPQLPEPRDRWARNRKGDEVPNPEGCETFSVHLWKTERKDLADGTPRMRVSWAVPDGGRGYLDANCFEEKLFPWLAEGTKAGKKTTIYIVRKDKYRNVIGVRA